MTRSFILLLLLTTLALPACAPSLATIQRSDHPGKALLLIDMQLGVLSTDGPATMGEKRAAALIAANNSAIDAALKSGIPIAFVKNEWPGWRFAENWWFNGAFRKGSDWAQIDPRLLVRIPKGEQVFFSKSIPSAFSDPALQPWLEKNMVGELIIGGLYGDQCITATVRDALVHGYLVRLVPNGIATRDEADLTPALDKLTSKGAEFWHEP